MRRTGVSVRIRQTAADTTQSETSAGAVDPTKHTTSALEIMCRKRANLPYIKQKKKRERKKKALRAHRHSEMAIQLFRCIYKNTNTCLCSLANNTWLCVSSQPIILESQIDQKKRQKAFNRHFICSQCERRAQRANGEQPDC